jgi:hypothetical protein
MRSQTPFSTEGLMYVVTRGDPTSLLYVAGEVQRLAFEQASETLYTKSDTMTDVL